MARKSMVEILVGLFMLVGMFALIFLAFRVSGLTDYSDRHHYVIYADFDNIGDLKVRAPVTIGGVRIGQVSDVTLDSNTFRARVALNINNKFNDIPTDSIAVILTQGLLGSNYISLTPGFDQTVMKNGSVVETTRSAIILENLIGQFLLNMKGDGNKNKDNDAQQSPDANNQEPAAAQQQVPAAAQPVSPAVVSPTNITPPQSVAPASQQSQAPAATQPLQQQPQPASPQP